MSYKDTLKEKAGSGRSIAIKIAQHQSQNPDYLFYVFEGCDDVHFYLPKIALKGHKFHTIIAKGKENVLFLQSKRESSFLEINFKKVFCFIDADHDKYISRIITDENLYITPHYSIENFFWTHDLVSYFLHSLLLDRYAELAEEIFAEWETLLDQFKEVMKPLMTDLICARLEGIKMDLNRVDLKKYLKLDSNQKILFNKQELESDFYNLAFLSPLSINKEKYQSVEDKISGDPIQQWVRGKYYLQFLLGFGKQIQNKLANKGISVQCPTSFEQFFKQHNCIVVNASCLNHFFDQI